MADIFDISNATKEDMKLLADGIEGYLDLLEDIIVIPKELADAHGKRIRAGITELREDLIKKLRKGKRSVFNDEDDWNPL